MQMEKNFLLTLFILALVFCSYCYATKKKTCKDYKNQVSALDALNAGATWLDRDHDKTPCENLPKQ